jgi:biofilm PGA synthesis N-glycosyltransferase PgaC
LETASLICIIIITYTYLGYPVLIWLGAVIKKMFNTALQEKADAIPTITLIVPAYNEAAIIGKKIENCLALNFPRDRLFIIVVTDGSVDGTPAVVTRYPQAMLLHDAERKGKLQALEHAIRQVKSELVVFTDANTMLNPEALQMISMHFADPSVGAVAGEKRVSNTSAGQAVAGEGWYWYYESWLKKAESDFYSVMGAAGELFCIRTRLYEPLPANTLLDDLAISLEIVLKGYCIRYEPNASATEPASHNTGEELERKIRIAAGGWQSLQRYGLRLLLARPLLAFMYISHRVLRWTLVPYALIWLFMIGVVWVWQYGLTGWPAWLFVMQLVFYLVACAGWVMERKKIKAGWLFVPFYFSFMHYAMIAGLLRYCTGKQTVLWKKAGR